MCLHESKGDNSTTVKPNKRLLKWALPPIIKNIKIVKSFSTNHISKHTKQNTPLDINKLPFPYSSSNSPNNIYHNDSNSQIQANSSNYINVYLDKLLLRKSESFMNQQPSCRYSTVESKTPIISSIRHNNNNFFNRRIEAYNNKQNNNTNSKGRNNHSKYNEHKIEYTFLTEMLERIRHRVSFISFKNKELYEKEVENIVNDELTHLTFNKNNQFNRNNFTSYGVELNPMRMFPSHSNASNYEEIVSYKKSIKHMPQGNYASGSNRNKNTQLRHLLLNEPSILSFLMNNPNKESFFSMLINQDKAQQAHSNSTKHQRRTSRNTNITINNNSSIKHIKRSKCSSLGRTTNDSSMVVLKGNSNSKSNTVVNPVTEPNHKESLSDRKYKDSKSITKRSIKELPSMLFHTITECTNTTGDEMKNIIKPTQRYLKRKTIKQRTIKNKVDNDYIKEERVPVDQKEKELTKIIERNTMVRKLINIGRVKARRGVDVLLLNATYRNRVKSNKNHLLEKSNSVSEIKSILSNSARNINDKYSPCKLEDKEHIEYIKPVYHKRKSKQRAKTIIMNGGVKNRRFRLSFITNDSGVVTGCNNSKNMECNVLFEGRKQRRTKTFSEDNRGKEKRKRRLSELHNEYNEHCRSLNKQKENKIHKVPLRRIKEKQKINTHKQMKKNIKSIEQKKQENEHVEQHHSTKLREQNVIIEHNESTSKPIHPVREIRKLKRTIRSDNSQILSALHSTECKSTSSPHPMLKLRNMNILPKRTYRFKKDPNSNNNANQRHEALKIDSNIIEERKHFFKDLCTNEEVEKRKQVLLMKIGHDITYGISKGELGEKEKMLFDKFREQIASLKVTEDEEYVDSLEENFYLFQKELDDLRRQRELEKRINGFMYHLREGLNNEKGKQEFHKTRARVVSAKSVFVSSNPFDDIIDNE